MELDYVKMGCRINKIRLEREMTQEQLAEKVGMSTNHLSHIEHANTKASLPILVRLANALETTIDTFLCDSLPTAKAPYINEITTLAEDCDEKEIRLFCEVLAALKKSYREI